MMHANRGFALLLEKRRAERTRCRMDGISGAPDQNHGALRASHGLRRCHARKSSPMRRPKNRPAMNRLAANRSKPSMPIALAIYGPSAMRPKRA